MTIPNYTMATVQDFVGRELGVTEWITIGQDRIDQFAACTGDQQWIHVDVARARRESPFGGPIAHGYLSLSLVAAMVMELGVIPPDAARAPSRRAADAFCSSCRAPWRSKARPSLRSLRKCCACSSPSARWPREGR